MALTKISGSILKDPLNLGEVSIGGTLTYQDVTNVDSVGIGTFRDGINVIGHTELDNVNVSGISTFGGSITISHATPQFKSIDTDGSNDYSTFQNSSGQSVYNAVDNNTHGKHLFQTAGTERMRIDSSGRVLIGTTTEGNSSADNLTVEDSGESGITVRSGTSNGGHIYFSDATSGTAEYQGLVSYQHNGDFMKFGTAATERLRINSTGQIITNGGSATPYPTRAATFQAPTGQTNCYVSIVAANTSSTSGLTFGDTGSAAAGNYAGMIEYNHNTNDMKFYTNATEKLRITSDGILILNASTAASGTKLAIQSTASSGSGTATGIRVGNNIGALSVYPANIEVRTTGVSDYNAIRTDAGDGNGGFTCGVEGYNGFLNLTTGGSNIVNVKLHTSGVSYLNGGNIGINSTVPSKKLDVRGNTIANQFLARSLPTSSYTTSTTGFKYGARGSYALSIGGTRSGNSSSFTICDIKDFNNSKFFRIEISFAHAGGGIHGSYRRMAGICNGYTSIQTWSDTGNVNTGGGGGFTISKPDQHTLRIVWNGASSYADNYTLYCLVNVSYEGSYFSYIDSAFY